MIVTMIVAMAENEVIGAGNHMPWKLPEDKRRFRKLTLGKPVIMGRKTHEAIGKRLPGRYNIVMTRDRKFNAKGCKVVYSKEEALRMARKEARRRDINETMIIGGEQIYDLFLGLAERIYLTQIHYCFSGDRHFAFDRDKWREIERIDGISENGPAYSFLTLRRK